MGCLFSGDDITCKPGERLCDNGNYCLKEDYFCDGEEDCVNGEDEQNCNYTCKAI